MWEVGDRCYFIESNREVISGMVKQVSGDFLLIRFGFDRGIRLRKSKVYKTEEEAKSKLPVVKPESKGYRPPGIH